MSEIALGRLRGWGRIIAIILGSGLNALAQGASAERAISYSEFRDLPKTSVPGHAGRFVLKQMHAKPIVYAEGRIHLYEGCSAQDVSAGVRVLAAAGIKHLVLTNAAGTLNENFSPGSWMMITDHINLTGATPPAERPNEK